MSGPPSRRVRVIVDTDAKNEADDQFAIVHAILTPTFDLRGIVPAHFGDRRSAQSLRDSRDEVDLLLRLMELDGRVRVEDGAERAMPDETTPQPSRGAGLIVEEALRDDAGPLFVAFYGPLTDMAAALAVEPSIAERDVTVVWIGGAEYPGGGFEYNLSNDIPAANAVFGSTVPVWQVPKPVYQMLGVGYAEMAAKVAPCGELGEYLLRQTIEWNDTYAGRPMEYRSLGDSPCVGLIMNPDGGRWSMRPAPRFAADMTYIESPASRRIRVYDAVDTRFILEDFFAKLAAFHRARTEGVTECWTAVGPVGRAPEAGPHA
jgi:inosine-uridine nucleoside N-ribohydrolase